MNDVVVTGFGVFTAFGYGVEALSEAVFMRQAGIFRGKALRHLRIQRLARGHISGRRTGSHPVGGFTRLRA